MYILLVNIDAHGPVYSARKTCLFLKFFAVLYFHFSTFIEGKLMSHTVILYVNLHKSLYPSLHKIPQFHLISCESPENVRFHKVFAPGN